MAASSFHRLGTFVACATAVVALVSCGGTTEPGEPGDATPTQGDTGNGGGTTTLDPDTAVVTVGEKTYEFTMTSAFGDTCLTSFGFVGGGGTAIDGSDVSLEVDIPPEGYETDERTDWDPPALRISDGVANEDWRAGDEIIVNDSRIPAGSSQVDSFTNDGNVAKGTATFIDYSAFLTSFGSSGVVPDSVQGTFEVYCE